MHFLWGWGCGRQLARLPVHSENSRVRFDPEKSPRGPDPFWGQTYPDSGQTDPESSQKDILDSDSGHFYPDSRSVWPRNGSGPMGPFSGSNLTREFLECNDWKARQIQSITSGKQTDSIPLGKKNTFITARRADDAIIVEVIKYFSIG